jgi:DtxR family Mn-dependent transcriptional regulator
LPTTRTPTKHQLSTAQQDYLKALYQLAPGGNSVSTSHLADELGIAAASVTEMLGKLAGLGLVAHDRYKGAELTAAGRSAALEMIRHHRLLEMYLSQALGYPWDEVHEEAERLEHVISERMEERIFIALGRPSLDPHGDPIPTAGGEVSAREYRSLDKARAGERLTIRRVSDRDAEKLRALSDLGLKLGTAVEVMAESRFESPVEVRVGRRRLQVPLGLARILYLEPAADANGRAATLRRRRH